MSLIPRRPFSRTAVDAASDHDPGHESPPLASSPHIGSSPGTNPVLQELLQPRPMRNNCEDEPSIAHHAPPAQAPVGRIRSASFPDIHGASHGTDGEQEKRPDPAVRDIKALSVQDAKSALIQRPYEMDESDVAQIAKYGGIEALQAVMLNWLSLAMSGFSPADITFMASNKGAAETLPVVVELCGLLSDMGFPRYEIVRVASDGDGAGAWRLRQTVVLYGALRDREFSSDTITTALHYSDVPTMREMLRLAEDPSHDDVLRNLVLLLERFAQQSYTTLPQLVEIAKNPREVRRTLKQLEKRTFDPLEWRSRTNPANLKPRPSSVLSTKPSLVWATQAHRSARENHASVDVELMATVSSILVEPPYSIDESDVARIAETGGIDALQAVKTYYADLITAGLSPRDITDIATKKAGAEALREMTQLHVPLEYVGLSMEQIVRIANHDNGHLALQSALMLGSGLHQRGFSRDAVLSVLRHCDPEAMHAMRSLCLSVTATYTGQGPIGLFSAQWRSSKWPSTE